MPDSSFTSSGWPSLLSELAVKGLEIEIVVGTERELWRASLAGCPDWQPSDPLADPKLQEDLETLREVDHQPLPTTERGQLTVEAAGVAADLRRLAVEVGDQLTEALLSHGRLWSRPSTLDL